MADTKIKMTLRKPATAKTTAAQPDTSPTKSEAVRKLIAHAKQVNGHFIDRERMVTHLLLGVVSRTNVLLFGPPGVAKTEVVDAVVSAFAARDDVYSTLLTKYTTPDEILGPVDLKAYEAGTLSRMTSGYMPSARVAVVDEIFKGSSAILNALLSLSNERRIRIGAGWVQTKLRMIVGMSNEYPEDAKVLGAFYDRYPAKHIARYLDDGGFRRLLTLRSAGGSKFSPQTIITSEDLEAIDTQYAAVTFSPEALDAVCEFRANLMRQKIVPSDRRWMAALGIARAAALLKGKATVDVPTLRVLACCLWTREEEIPKIEEEINRVAAPESSEIKRASAFIAESMRKMQSDCGTSGGRPDLQKVGEFAARNVTTFRALQDKMNGLNAAGMGQEEAEELALVKAQIADVFKLFTSIMAGGDVEGDYMRLLQVVQ